MRYAALTAVLAAAVLNGWLYVSDRETMVVRTAPTSGEAVVTNFAFRKPLLADERADQAEETAEKPQSMAQTSFLPPDVKPIFDSNADDGTRSGESLDNLACLALAPLPAAEITALNPLLERYGWIDRVIMAPIVQAQYRVHAGPFKTGQALKRQQAALTEAGIRWSAEPTEQGTRLYLGYFTDSAAAKAWAQHQAARLQIERMVVTNAAPQQDAYELVFTNLSTEENKLVRETFAPALPGVQVRACR